MTHTRDEGVKAFSDFPHSSIRGIFWSSFAWEKVLAINSNIVEDFWEWPER